MRVVNHEEEEVVAVGNLSREEEQARSRGVKAETARERKMVRRGGTRVGRGGQRREGKGS